jgi:hypothetical protein
MRSRRRRGFRVARAVGVEREMKLAYAALQLGVDGFAKRAAADRKGEARTLVT